MENDHVSWHKHLRVDWLREAGGDVHHRDNTLLAMTAAGGEYTGTEIDFCSHRSATIPAHRKGGKAGGNLLWKMNTDTRHQGHSLRISHLRPPYSSLL